MGIRGTLGTILKTCTHFSKHKPLVIRTVSLVEIDYDLSGCQSQTKKEKVTKLRYKELIVTTVH